MVLVVLMLEGLTLWLENASAEKRRRLNRLSRWDTTLKAIKSVNDGTIEVALTELYRLIKYVYDSIPEEE